MLRDDGVALIKQQLAFRQTLDSAIVSQLQFAQTSLEAMPTKPWFLISSWTTFTTVDGEEETTLPSDFIGEVEESHFWYRSANYPDTKDRILFKDDYDTLKETFKDTERDFTPRAYACTGSVIDIFPLPDDAYSIRYKYYQKQNVLSTNIENGWLANVPMLILGSALKLIAMGPIRDQIASQVADSWISSGNALLRSMNEQFRSTSREDQIGGRHW